MKLLVRGIHATMQLCFQLMFLALQLLVETSSFAKALLSLGIL